MQDRGRNSLPLGQSFLGFGCGGGLNVCETCSSESAKSASGHLRLCAEVGRPIEQ